MNEKEKENKTMKEEKSNQEAISKIISKINGEYGEVMTTLEGGQKMNKDTISTGSFLLDNAIGGGYPYGKIIELYGMNSSGKSTLALQAAASCQKEKKIVVYIDVENSLNRNYAEKLGVEARELIIVSPKNGEEALDLVSRLVGVEKIGLIIIDSVAALVPKAELEGDLEKQTIGLRARMMSTALGKINSALTDKEVVIIFINQIRNKINTGFSFGNTETTSGGIALSFFASMRIRLREIGKIEKTGASDEFKYIGIKTQALVKKNRMYAPYQEVVLSIIFGKGTEKEREITELAVENGLIEKKAS